MSRQQDYDIKQQATLLFEESDIPLNKKEWSQLADLLAKSKYEHIVAGDANESHSVWVSRYFNDVVSPEALNSLSSHIESIVMSAKMCAFYQRFTGTKKLYLRRCQANRLYQGDYIGVHKDQDSSPDYLATIVFHFSENYSGGYFQTDDPNNPHPRYKPGVHMALVNNCSVPHQVTKVESGERLTLACFLSGSFAPNKTSPSAFKINNDRPTPLI
ncbi:MAG: 2OG-Fe(II) oxygenase [Pseudomonadota bacterium]|nr:2OG-Fe(II) oxygenase [Pseudomonadota bacterium]